MTHGSNEKPVRRVLGDQLDFEPGTGKPDVEYGDQYVVSLTQQHVTIRPKGARPGSSADVVVHVAHLYRTHFAPPAKAKRAPKVKRGLLT